MIDGPALRLRIADAQSEAQRTHNQIQRLSAEAASPDWLTRVLAKWALPFAHRRLRELNRREDQARNRLRAMVL